MSFENRKKLSKKNLLVPFRICTRVDRKTVYRGFGLEPLENRVLLSSYTLQTLASFNGINGAAPLAGVIMDSGGNLYGTTHDGGANNNGTVFKVTTGSDALTTLVSFNGTNGSRPAADLIMDSSGNLYGTTEIGGVNGAGTVFEVTAASSTLIVLASFNNTNGAQPDAGLIIDSSGNLYGTEFR